METKKQKIGNWFKTSISARMLVVGFIFLILLIPLSFVKDLSRERETRQAEVIQEINEKWGNEVVLYGPIVKVPYKTYTEEKIFDEQTNGPDLVLGLPIRFGMGYGLNNEQRLMGANPNIAYWGGWGGSSIVIDQDARLCVSYVMNRMAANRCIDCSILKNFSEYQSEIITFHCALLQLAY